MFQSLERVDYYTQEPENETLKRKKYNLLKPPTFRLENQRPITGPGYCGLNSRADPLVSARPCFSTNP